MKTRLLLAVLGIALAGGPVVRALDQIKTSKALVSGTIKEVGKYEVKINRTGGEEAVPTNDIEYIRFDGEPPQLNIIRSHVLGGRYNDALDALAKLTETPAKLEIKQEIDYLRAISKARLALSGSADLREAGSEMANFLRANPGSYHFLEANELVGDLLVALGDGDKAVPFYDALGQAPWPDTKMRGAVAKGRALMVAKKYEEALPVFDSALTLAGSDTSELVVTQKQAATIGKASCLAAAGQHDQGIQMLEEVVSLAKAEDRELHAAAYNALGGCYRKAGNPKAALLAYLHVDLLYNSFPLAHAEALANLTELWKEIGNGDRALQAEQLLQDRYKNTPFAKK
jgi:tetratricopeptide (TPR) repeat protein